MVPARAGWARAAIMTDGSDSEHRYRELYDRMPVMYFEMDDQGVVVSVNAFGAGQLGYVPADLEGRSVMDVFHEDDRETVALQFQSLLDTGGDVASWEFRKRRKDGSVLWVRETARALRNSAGRMEVMVVCQDITARKRAEEERTEAEQMVRQLSLQLDQAQERERRRIAVHLHDDVGQTLALAKIKLGRVAGGAGGSGAELAEVKDLIQQAIEDTRSLTFDLASPVLYELGLADALRSLCDRQEDAGETSFEYEGEEDLRAVPERLAVPLYRIASELAFNVRKHARATRARIDLECRDGRVRLAVEDDGEGFDPASVHESSQAPGGIGLFSIEQRVNLLGGEIRIRSAPGQGSRVEVEFALDPESVS